MDEPTRLRALTLDALAAEMSAVQEGAPARSKYVAEFHRRQAVVQRQAAFVAVGGVVVSALAIVVGAASSVRTDAATFDAVSVNSPICPPSAASELEPRPMAARLTDNESAAISRATIEIIGADRYAANELAKAQQEAWSRRQDLRIDQTRRWCADGAS